MNNYDSTKRRKIENRRRLVARLFCEGVSNQFDIVSELRSRYGIDVSQCTVSRDLRYIENEWQKERLADVATVKNRLLAKYDLIYSEAMGAWMKSLEDVEVIVKELRGMVDVSDDSTKKRVRQFVKKYGQSGNSSLLAQAQSALRAIREIIGTDAPTKQDVIHSGEVQNLIILPQKGTDE